MNNGTTQITASQQRDAIQRLLDSGRPFALFRYPNSCQVELILQNDDEVKILNDSETIVEGFVFAPFRPTRQCPSLLLRSDAHAKSWEDIVKATQTLPPSTSYNSRFQHHDGDACEVMNSPTYETYFANAMEKIRKGELEKIVLSYCQKEEADNHLFGKEADVFLRALDKYPNSMVSLVQTPQSGRWMGCTPETLLQRDAETWSTMALAGTRVKEEKEWDDKNRAEQNIVTRYVNSTLEQLGAEVKDSQISTMHTGNLMHIRTDISFRFTQPEHTLRVVRTLHPTPAICGLPKQTALQCILQQEGESRHYFAGYLGTIRQDYEAHLYVNLRCAHISPTATYYHAGGGITALSQLSNEKQEIANKLNTLKRLISP